MKSKAPLREALINLIETANLDTQTVSAERAIVGLTDNVLEGLLAIGFVNGELIFFECAECPKWRRVGFKTLKRKLDNIQEW